MKIENDKRPFAPMDDFEVHLTKTLLSFYSLKPTTSMEDLQKESDYDHIIHSIEIPQYTFMDLMKRTTALKSNMPLPEFFETFHHAFQFKPDVLKTVISQAVNLPPKLSYYSQVFILNCFVSWIQIYVISKSFDFIEIIFESLSKIYSLQCESTVIDAFCDVYEVFLKEDTETLFDILFPIIYSTYVAQHNLPSYCYPYLSRTFAKLVNPKDETFSPEVVKFNTLLTLLFVERKDMFNETSSRQFYTCAEPFLNKFDVMALTFFSNLCSILPQDLSRDALTILPKKMISFIEETPQHVVLPTETDSTYEDLIQEQQPVKFAFPQYDSSFPNGFDPKVSPCTFPEPQYKDICHASLITRLGLIEKSIRNELPLKSAFIGSYVSQIRKHPHDDHFLDIFSSFLVFCAMNEDIEHFFDVIDIIISSNIFNPKFNVFTTKTDFHPINSMRHYATRLILRQSLESIKEFMNYISSYPVICTEFNERMIANIDLIHSRKYNTSDFIQLIVEPAVRFRYSSEEAIEVLDRARLSTFHLINVILYSHDYLGLFFSNEYFLTFFFSCLFESKIKQYILDQINRYLFAFSNSLSKTFLSKFQEAFAAICKNTNTELVLEIISSLFKAFEHGESLAPHFLFMLKDFCDVMCDQSHMQIVFKYLMFLGDSPTITENLLSKIESKMSSFPTDFLFKNAIDIMAGKENASYEKGFDITQPNVLKLFKSFFWKIDKQKVLHILTSLAQYSLSNCITIHKIKYDLFLVNELKTEENDEMIDSILELLKLVEIVVSSPVIVQKFISLLKSTDFVISKNQSKYIDFLDEMIKANYNLPISTLPLEPNFTIMSHLKTPINTTLGFSFTAWIFIETLDEVVLFQFESSQALIIHGTDLQISDILILSDLPVKQWFLLSVTFFENTISTFINKMLKEQVKYEKKLFKDSVSYVIYGGGQKKSGKMSCFGLYPPIKKTNIRSLNDIGPRLVSPPDFPYYDFYTPSRITDACIDQLHSVETKNFAEILLKVSRIELLLPLFAQLDMKTSDGQHDPNRIKSISSFIRNALLIDEDEQHYFYNIKGFAIISHLITSSNFQDVSYDFYLIFYKICQEIAVEELRDQLIQDILINFELWSQNISDFVKISSHWAKTLFEGYECIKHRLLPFEKLLDLMRLYLWYTPADQSFLPIRGIESKTHNVQMIAQIRHNITTIILEIYQESITAIDLVLLISHCMNCQDNNQVYDLLLILDSLIPTAPALPSFCRSTESYAGLHMLLMTNDEFVVTTTAQIIAKCHKNDLILDFTLPERVDIMFHQMKTMHINESLLMKFTILINETPEFFPICCYFGNVLGPEIVQMMFDKLSPTPDFCCSPVWAIWAVYAAIVNNEELRKKIFIFLVQCSPTQWEQLFYLIERISDEKDVEKNEALYLDILIGNVSMDTMTNTFYDIYQFFLLFRKNRTHNKRLLKLANVPDKPIEATEIPGSEFNAFTGWMHLIDEDNREWLSGGNPIDQETDPESKLIDSTFKQANYTFGIRLDENGNWIDSELAKKCISLSQCFRRLDSIDFILVLCAFLVEYDYDFVFHYIKSMQFKNEELQAHGDFLFLVIKRAARFNKPWCLPVEPYNYYPKSVIALDKMPQFLLPKSVMVGQKIIEQIRYFTARVYQKASILFKRKPYDLKKFAGIKMDNTIENISRSMSSAKKAWLLLWNHMTMDHAPWDLTSNVPQHYMRDTSACSFFCPIRTKKNRHFDQHTIAAEMRDLGRDIEPAPVENIERHPLTIADDVQKINDDVPIEQKLILSEPCQVIKMKKKNYATFNLYPTLFKITYEGSNKMKLVSISSVKHLFWRRKVHQPTGLEIFMVDGKSILLSFLKVKGGVIGRKIANLQPPQLTYNQQIDFKPFFASTGLTEKWINNEISNFEYLMNCSIFAGRSYNDPSQYPFLPWVIKDFESTMIDLKNLEIYRDLTKPVGALNEERLKDLYSRYEDLTIFGVKPFLYSSYASSPLSVFLFLLRLEPFTSLHIELQGGRFDNASRLFYSIQQVYSSVLTQMNDYRELPAEFYFQPEFLLNMDHFDLGKADGEVVDDVTLPPWAKNVMNYVYMNRKALESEYVSQTIHNWIDLIYGIKQRGKESVDSSNVYKQEMYDDIWKTEANNMTDIRRGEIETTVEQVGQIPPQLFTSKHPQRATKKIITLANEVQQLDVMQSSLVFASIQEGKGKLTITSIKTDGGIFKGKITTENLKYVTESEKPSNDRLLTLVSVNQLGNDLYVGLLKNRLDIHFMGSQTTTTRKKQRITSIATSKDWLTFSTEDARTQIFSPNSYDKAAFSIPTYRNVILCSCISEEFGISVSGTDDCALIVCSIHDGRNIRVIDTQGIQPYKVLVTPAWGFILIIGTRKDNDLISNHISIYNVNGLFINTIQIDQKVQHVISWASYDSFDYIAYYTTSGNYYIFEAYYLEPQKPVYKYCSNTVGMFYSNKYNALISVCADGKILVIPKMLQ